MICVQTPSRLHFGLFRVARSVSADGYSGRRFGGVGLMVKTPGLRLALHPDKRWSAEGPLADRALAFSRRFVETLPDNALVPQHFIIEQAPPEHVGLGTGTQLGLAVARALAMAAGRSELDATELARRIGRGQRSALGIHGFEHGGFLVEGGKRELEDISPLVARVTFPEEWRVLLVTPARQSGLHGDQERRAFENLEGLDPTGEQTDTLWRLTQLNMLPMLAVRDLAGFGEALYEFNAGVGRSFAPVQGGTYANPKTAELVAFLREQGIRGVGQSSWGPTVFAILGNDAEANDLAILLRRQFRLKGDEVVLTRACNQGATVIL
jgi:beta-ribofuranosylaminobenzene 5'-phosphate synthase